MDTNGNTANKSVKQKTKEELQADLHAADHYKFEQQEVLHRGEAAKTELAMRLMQELNIKAGNALHTSRKAKTIIDAANRNQLPADKDIILMAVVVDNSYAKEGNMPLGEENVHSICKAALQEHLEEGVLISAVGVQNTEKSNLKQFTNTLRAYDACISQGDKMQASAINRKYGVTLAFKPLSYLPEG